ncbi:MAG: hypothetical protein PVJ57_06110 [Phycisphaerae bacterium]
MSHTTDPREVQPAASCGVARRLSVRSGGLGLRLAIPVLLFGPATGTLHALHLAHAGSHHHTDSCSLCQQILTTSKYVPEIPTIAVVGFAPCLHGSTIPSVECPRTSRPTPVLPRGPPLLAAC